MLKSWAANMSGSILALMNPYWWVGQFIEMLECRQGLKVACPEEITYRNQWIDAIKLERLAEPLSKNVMANTCTSADRGCLLMKATPLEMPEVILFEAKVFDDERGCFFESFNLRQFEAAVGRAVTFGQDNHARSAKGVLRGLHCPIQQPQGMLVRVVQGEVFDVAVDILRRSRTFGRWLITNKTMLSPKDAKASMLAVAEVFA